MNMNMHGHTNGSLSNRRVAIRGSQSTICNLQSAIILALLALLAPLASALINPKFTPVHLTEQSDAILVLEFKDGADKDGKVKATVKKALKGKVTDESLVIELPGGDFVEQGKKAKEILDGAKEGLLFIGRYESAGGDSDKAKGMLHVRGTWMLLSGGDKGAWDLDKIDNDLNQTWAGSTDMLRRAIEYVISDSEADVPSVSEDRWGKGVNFGKIAGKVTALQPLDLAGQVAPWLYVASDGGDKLFALKDGNLADMTGQRKLAAKSVASLWASFSAGGKLDLLSFDGKALTLHKQQEDGTFTAPCIH